MAKEPHDARIAFLAFCFLAGLGLVWMAAWRLAGWTGLLAAIGLTLIWISGDDDD